MTTQKHDFAEGQATVKIRIDEEPPVARFSLRLRPAGAEAMGRALGLALPRNIGARACDGSREIACLGPDEWVIRAPEEDRDHLCRSAAAIYDSVPHSLCDISDREVTLRLSGPEALTALAAGCPRDLDRFAPGDTVRTLFDSVTVVLWRDAGDAVRIDVWRSFLPHVRAILAQVEDEIAAGI